MRRIVLLLLLGSCGVEHPTKPEFRPAPEGEVASVVTRAVADAHREQRRLLVYVGATWCEPCRRFHRAVEEGKLDSQFPDLRFPEFDAYFHGTSSKKTLFIDDMKKAGHVKGPAFSFLDRDLFHALDVFHRKQFGLEQSHLFSRSQERPKPGRRS